MPDCRQIVLDIEPNGELSFEANPVRYSYWIVLRGVCRATVESLSIDLEAGQVITAVPHASTYLENPSSDALKLLYISVEGITKKV